MLIRNGMRLGVRLGLRPVFSPRVPLLAQRSYIAVAAKAFPRAAGVQDIEHYLGGVLSRRLIPESAPSGMAVMYLHGGGMCIQSERSASAHDLVASLVRRLGCAAYSVGYRLAPEHPFPCGLRDAYAVLRFVHAAAEHAGAPLVLAGDSAGANLALVVAGLSRRGPSGAACANSRRRGI